MFVQRLVTLSTIRIRINEVILIEKKWCRHEFDKIININRTLLVLKI